MVQILEAQIPQRGITVNQPVMQSAELATANNERKMRALESLRSTADAFGQRMKAAQDATDLYNNVNDAQLNYARMFDQMQQEAQNSPDGASQKFIDTIGKDIDKRLESISDVETKTKLGSNLTSLMTSYGTHALQWENNRKVQIMAGNFEDRERNRLGLIKDSNGNLKESDGLYSEYVADLNEAKSWMPQERFLALEDEAKGKFYGTAIEARISASPGSALNELQKGLWDDKLDTLQKAKAVAEARSRVDQLNAGARQALRDRMENELSRALTVGGGNGLALLPQIESAFGTETAQKFASDLSFAAESNAILQGLVGKTPEQRAAAIQSLDEVRRDPNNPNFIRNNKLYEAAVQQNSRVDEMLRKDAFSTVVSTMPGKPNINDVFREYDVRGVDEYSRGVMPEASAQKLATQFTNERNKEKIISEIINIHDQYGPKFSYAVRQIQKAGAPTELMAAAMMDPSTEYTQMNMLVDVALMKPDELNQVAGLDKTDKDELRATLQDELDQYMTAQADSGRMLKDDAALVDLTQKMAMGFYARTGDIDKSARMATSWITNKYNYNEINNHSYMVPKIIQAEDGSEVMITPEIADTVNDMAMRMQAEMSGGTKYTVGIPITYGTDANGQQVPIPVMPKKQYLRNIQEEGFWVLDDSERYLNLMIKNPETMDVSKVVAQQPGEVGFKPVRIDLLRVNIDSLRQTEEDAAKMVPVKEFGGVQ